MRNLGILIAVAVALALSGPWFGSAAAQSWRTVTSSRQVWDREPLDVEITYGVGELTISPAEAPYLYQMELRYDADNFEPEIEFDEESRELQLGVESVGRDRRRRNLREGSRAQIALTREVPVDLDLEFGAGEATIELGGMSLTALSISTGASDTEVRFSQPNRIAAEGLKIEAGAADLRVIGIGNLRASTVEFQGGVGATVLDFSGASADIAASVEMGVGSVTLRLPRSHGIQVNRSSFLTSFDAAGLESRDGNYYSANWNSAANKIVLDVSAALGSIEIQFVD